MASHGRARLAVAQGLSVWLLEAPHGFGEPTFHAHHAIQITVCLAGKLALSDEHGTLDGQVLAVAADAAHRLSAEGVLGIVFVEPESPSGRALAERLFAERGLVAIDEPRLWEAIAPLRSAIDVSMAQGAMVELGWAAVSALVGSNSPPPPDPRIQRIIDYAADHLDQSLQRAAEAAGVYLSHARLRHLFVEQTGLPFKTYMLWTRLVRAVQLYSEGHSLTEAAHAAGFADSAHFSRAFKRTFGSPATTLTRL